jgi:hypothetical protein
MSFVHLAALPCAAYGKKAASTNREEGARLAVAGKERLPSALVPVSWVALPRHPAQCRVRDTPEYNTIRAQATGWAPGLQGTGPGT